MYFFFFTISKFKDCYFLFEIPKQGAFFCRIRENRSKGAKAILKGVQKNSLRKIRRRSRMYDADALLRKCEQILIIGQSLLKGVTNFLYSKTVVI